MLPPLAKPPFIAVKKYLVEFIGTFFLVFTVGCTLIPPGAGALAPLAIGASLMVMMYAGGHVSGGHFNPAITLAVWMRGKLEAFDLVPYWLAQFAAAVLAAWVMHFFKLPDAAKVFAIGIKAAVLAELLFTFALTWVFLNVTTARGTAGNSFYGLAVGMTMMAGLFTVSRESGGAFNPAIALGDTMMGLSTWANIWVFFVGNFGGAAIAALTYRLVNGDE
jgi:aquaporin Z